MGIYFTPVTLGPPGYSILRRGFATLISGIALLLLVTVQTPMVVDFGEGGGWALAGHADPRPTRLYNRRDKKIIRKIVERTSI